MQKKVLHENMDANKKPLFLKVHIIGFVSVWWEMSPRLRLSEG